MTEYNLALRARRVVTSSGERAATVLVQAGRIVAIEALDYPADDVVELADDEVLLPGLVDTHVHVNEPGRTEWEGFTTATRAAAAGGVTTIIDMPLNSVPPTCTVSALRLKQAAAREQAFVDVGFWGGAIPSNLATLAELWAAGVYGFKSFLLDSGVEEFPPLNATQLEQALTETAAFDGLLIVHAEDAETIEHAPATSGPAYQGFLASRPRAAENRAITALIDATRRTGARSHLLHLSSSDALPAIAAARADGVRLSVETCPHYLHFSAEEIPDGRTEFKCCPPIREADNRDLLWSGLRDGLIDCVVSDHSPCTHELKRLDTGDFGLAWGGVASLQLGLSSVWTQARRRGVALADVSGWMSRRTADLAAVVGKGRIEVGYDADFCVFAPESSFVVELDDLHHRNRLSAYAGRELTGSVRSTWLRGHRINENNTVSEDRRGVLLTRGESTP